MRIATEAAGMTGVRAHRVEEQPGDVLRSEIEGIGSLGNRCIAGAA
jgi:hypothetical protein